MKQAISVFFTLLLAIGLSTSASAQAFGGAVAYSGDQLFVGETANTTSSGTLYVYERDGSGSWVESTRLQASDNDGADDRFGRALAVDGQTLIVGSTTKDAPLGAAYVFQKDGSGNWIETARLAMDDNSKGGSFGRAIALDGDFAMISAAGYDSSKGAVFVFKRGMNNDWAMHSKLVASDAPANTLFGLALDMNGNQALIGAQVQNQNTGAVYAFTYNEITDSWEDQGAVNINGMQDSAQLGAAVALDGHRALVSAPGLGNGSVMMLDFNAEAGSWNHSRTLNPIDGEPGYFGGAVGFRGDDIWVGAPFAYGTGAIYRFRVNETGSIVSADRFTTDGMTAGAQFGTTFSFMGDELVVGAPGVDFGLGTTLVLEEQNSKWVESARFFTEQEGMEAITGAEVTCENGGAQGFECEGVDMLSFIPVGEMGGTRGVGLNDIWGWTDEETGREFALVGRVDGTSFVEITDPLNPIYLGDLQRTEGTPPANWRDMKVYKDHVYIVADGAQNHGIQIFDLQQLKSVMMPPVQFEETARYDGIASAHNIVINESTGFAYTVGNNSGGDTCGGGSHMLDLSNPVEPTFVGCWGHEGTGNANTGYSHDSMCITYDGPDVEHLNKEICFGSNETSLSIADVTDKSNPVALSKAEYPNVGYTHQGWITPDHSYFYSNDETDETNGSVATTRTLVWDVSDLDDPVLVKEHMGTTAASDHNLYIRGNYMYQSNYAAGLRILDISDPANPVEVAYFDTSPTSDNVPGFSGSWSNYPYFSSGTLIVTSRNEGLFLLKKREVDI